MTTEKQIERLVKEWLQHGKIVIGIDFDDTISRWSLADEEDCNDVIERLKQARQTGAYLTIFTACNKDRFTEIQAYCAGKRLIIDTINENPISLPYGHNGKIQANIFIDDRAGLNEALTILEKAMYIVRGKRNEETLTKQEAAE